MKRMLNSLSIIILCFCFFTSLFSMHLSDINSSMIYSLRKIQEIVRTERDVRGFLSKETKTFCFGLVKMPFRLEVYCSEEVKDEIKKLKQELADVFLLEALNLELR